MDDTLPPDEPLPTRTEEEGATVDLPEGMGFFSVGQVLGDRYEILEMLGRGGMGEVWRAFDLKLRVEVALKALREDLFQSERRLEMLRQEARAAREVVSPNVCRIFDLIEIDGRELVSMEYVDGATLLGVLQERGPLELKETQDIASQFLSGLEAIHKAGLVHRDVKPENIMLTRAGRVVVMDFGLARGPESGAGSVSGTPAYMAPEHAAGQEVDARADVYSAGVVLAEMVCPEGIKNLQGRQSVWEGVRSEPAKVPDTPWAAVIQRAVARDRDRRQNSAHALIRELEEVTLRVEGAEDLHPYPGLASFTESDAEFFFGREAEVEHLWRRLGGPPRMVAVVGPSGAGKTSFLQAGLIANASPGWTCVRCKPGNNPRLALGRSMAQALAGDAEAAELMLCFDDPDVAVEAVGKWRAAAPHALLVVDQFEELFTQCGFDEQRRFADLLSRIVLDADVHLLLSMRDDFLLRCHEHEALAPVFAGLTPLRAPSGGSLRRALVQPATTCGYRFEDDELVEEILAEVEGERGALPLLAFALARLWDKRDRETGLLTRQAYHDVGGVGGALARHAEATVDKIGVERIPIVRELLRNLVTAEGTRGVREWDELLSVFEDGNREGIKPSPTNGPDTSPRHAGMHATTKPQDDVAASFQLASSRDAAEEVLRELIDARLLTSYEVREDEHEPIRRVEIIHESLLANWPRLVRWQTQDQEGAQLRDEIRQAARSWDEHGRNDDRLWTGTAYREYAVWRERYPGGLTELEEVFGTAMTALAGRRRRRRRAAIASVLIIAAFVAVTTTALWRRSVLQQRRADAAALLSKAQAELESYPSAAVAFATASLELADTPEVRLVALEALWKGPTAFIVNQDRTVAPAFTPDGRWLVQLRDINPRLQVIGADGSSKLLEQIDSDDTSRFNILMGRHTGHFLSLGFGGERLSVGLWSASDQRLLACRSYESGQSAGFPIIPFAVIENQQRALVLVREQEKQLIDVLRFDGSVERLGAVDLETSTTDTGSIKLTRDPSEPGRIWATRGHDVFVVEAREHDLSQPSLVFRQESTIKVITIDPSGRLVATVDDEGHIRLWDITEPSRTQLIRPPTGKQFEWVGFSGDGALLISAAKHDADDRSIWLWSLQGTSPRLLRSVVAGEFFQGPDIDPVGLRVANSGDDPVTRIWRLGLPAEAEPLVLRRSEIEFMFFPEFSPNGQWIATADSNGLTLWPLARRFPAVIPDQGGGFGGLAFDPKGRWLASSSWNGMVRLWPLEGDVMPPGRVLFKSPQNEEEALRAVSVSPDGKRLLVGTENSGAWLISTNGIDVRKSPTFDGGAWYVAFSPDGQLAGQVGGPWGDEKGVVRVWETATGIEAALLEPERNPRWGPIVFTDNREILVSNESVLKRWNLETGDRDVIFNGIPLAIAFSRTGRKIALAEIERPNDVGAVRTIVVDLETGQVTELESRGKGVMKVAFDSTGEVLATCNREGVIHVGPISDEEPHFLLGHEGPIYNLAIDPKGRWIASQGQDRTVRLWPMPDLSKPPLHTLPREELIAKLKTLTNLRVVRDPESATGWTLTHDPFPGWETVPTW